MNEGTRSYEGAVAGCVLFGRRCGRRGRLPPVHAREQRLRRGRCGVRRDLGRLHGGDQSRVEDHNGSALPWLLLRHGRAWHGPDASRHHPIPVHLRGHQLLRAESSAGNYDDTATSVPADSAARVLSIARDQSAADAFFRVIKAAGVEYSSSDTSAVHQIPDHIAVANKVSDALTPTAANYGDVQLIGLVLIAGLPTDTELLNWLNGTDARTHISNIDHYWVASDVVDGGTGGITASIAPLVGSVPLDLYGPVASDLVAWP